MGYCYNRCSHQSSSPQFHPMCYNICLDEGHMMGYCRKKCTY
jgi:hypothetical protein